jgi:voltage-gated sodium channel
VHKYLFSLAMQDHAEERIAIQELEKSGNQKSLSNGEAMEDPNKKVEELSISKEKKLQQSYSAHGHQSSQQFSEADLRASKVQAKLWGVPEQHDELTTWLGAQRNFVISGLESLKFQLALGVLISTNAITIGLESDAMAKNQELDFLYNLEVFFSFAYTFEICVRIFGYGCKIFKDLSFLFDLFLVALAIVDTFILSTIAFPTQLSSFMMLRMLRLFKLARILRLLKLFRSLWLLLTSIIDSLRLLVWCGILLTILLYFAGIFTTQVIGARISGDFWEEEDQEYLRLRFGSVDRSMYTLFECMVGGDLMSVARRVYKGLPWMWVFFVMYTCVAMIAILNVIVAVIVENTMQHTIATNRENKRLEMECHHAALRQDLITLFKVADSTGDGTLSRDEWNDVLEDEEIMKSITHLQLTKDQCLRIFDALDTDGSKSLDSMEFLEGVMQGVHSVRVYDVMTLSSDLQKVEQRMEHSIQRIEKELLFLHRQHERSAQNGSDLQASGRKSVPVEETEKVLESSLEQRLQSIEVQHQANFERMQASLNLLLATQGTPKGTCASLTFSQTPRV